LLLFSMFVSWLWLNIAMLNEKMLFSSTRSLMSQKLNELSHFPRKKLILIGIDPVQSVSWFTIITKVFRWNNKDSRSWYNILLTFRIRLHLFNNLFHNGAVFVESRMVIYLILKLSLDFISYGLLHLCDEKHKWCTVLLCFIHDVDLLFTERARLTCN